MANTTKRATDFDHQQTLTNSYNEINATLGVDGFIVGKVGRKITRTAVSGVIEDWSFYDSSSLLYTIRITYDNSSHDNVDQIERTA